MQTPKIQRQPQQQNPQAAQGVDTGDPHLHDCRTLPDAGDLGQVLTRAQQSADEAVRGLQSKVNNWGNPSQTVLERATEMGLRKGFNMETDKSVWSILNVPQTEINKTDQRDRTAAAKILANFKLIQGNVGSYSTANQCEHGKFTPGNPCITCADEEHVRHRKGGAAAWVIEEQIGKPNSPVHLGPKFRALPTVPEKSEAFLHELAHLQTFAASDRLSKLGASYYGCPVQPSTVKAPRLMDPNQFIKIADSYRCFLRTQREYKGFYEEEEKQQQEATP